MPKQPHDWFELERIRRRNMADQVWIPLRCSKNIQKIGRFGRLGFRTEFLGVGSLAVSSANRDRVEGMGWSRLGLIRRQVVHADSNGYKPADIAWGNDWDEIGIELVVVQDINSAHTAIWHLNQDLIFALELLREGNSWIAPNEGYTEVARLVNGDAGRPELLEIKKNFLCDYLAARQMSLYLCSYRLREETVDDVTHIPWPDQQLEETTSKKNKKSRFQAQVFEIHEGGEPYGSKTAYYHIGRTDIDPEIDVPHIKGDEDKEYTSSSRVITHEGRKLYRVEGKLWQDEWVEHADTSPRVRGDDHPTDFNYAIDSAGNIAPASSLLDQLRYLWFRPELIMSLSHRRGGRLCWSTSETAQVACSPDYPVHFGVNDIGLVNVLAKDVCSLPSWQQQIWVGFNTTPEGGVSKELHRQQLEGYPVDTIAPEEALATFIVRLDQLFTKELRRPIVLHHQKLPTLLQRCHRFRSVSEEGFLALAKDVCKVLADNIDRGAFHSFLGDSANTGLGSLKSLEAALSSIVGETTARQIMAPIFGVYEFRVADAHISSNDLSETYKKALVSEDAPFVVRGYQLLAACADAFHLILDAFESHFQNGESE